MDLKTLKPKERKFNLRNPANDNPLGLLISVLPMSDEKVQKVRRHEQNKRLQKRKFKITAEQLDAQSNELIIAAVTGWEWTDPELKFDDEQPEFSQDQLRKWLQDDDLSWIRDQIDEELGDVASFFES